MTEAISEYFNDDNTFDLEEAGQVVEKWLCPVCHGELRVVYVPNLNDRVLVVCAEHGSVCVIGRVTRATVAIQQDNAFRNYHRVIRNLPDLWGHLADQGFERVQAGKITQYYVCAVGGCSLVMASRSDHPRMDVVDIVCIARHGNINDTGYIRRDQFKYDFQRIRDWEKKQREKRDEQKEN